tara:strand:- start:53 stop:208 length:156 start_codon:yes stop_codon:yes gene_type:complete
MFFLEKYIHIKHKPNIIVLTSEKLEPIMIEIGNIEMSINGILILELFIFFI